jgi:hypothetical protein
MKMNSKFLWAAFGIGAAVGAGAFVVTRYPNQPVSLRLRAATRELMDLAGPLLEEVLDAQKQARIKANDLSEQAQQQAHKAFDALDRGYGQVQIGLDVMEDKAADARDALESTAKAVQLKANDTLHSMQETAHTVQDSALAAKDTMVDSAIAAKDSVLAAKDQAKLRVVSMLEPLMESGAALAEQLQTKPSK